MGTGQTFLSTFLYLRTRTVGSAGRSGGTERGLGTCLGGGGVCGVALSWTEIILMEGARPARGCKDRKTLLDALVRSHMEISTLLLKSTEGCLLERLA